MSNSHFGGHMPPQAVENGNGQLATGLKKLAIYCKRYAVPIFIAVICAAAGAIFTILGPDKLSEMTNLITAGMMSSIDLDAFVSVGISLVIFYSVSAILQYIQHFIMTTITQRVSQGLRNSISRKINVLPLRYFDSTNTGDILSRVTNDVDTLAQTLNQSVGALVTAVATFLGSMIMMFKTDWVMALVAIGASIIGFIFMMLIVSRSQKYFIAQQSQLGAVNGHVEEAYSGHNVIVAYNAQDSMRSKFREINDKLYSSAWKSQFMSGIMMPLMNFVGNLGYVAVCVVGASLAMNGKISFGTIVAFIVYVRLFSQPLSQIAQSMTNLQSAGAASMRVFEFLDEEELSDESEKSGKLDTAKGNVEFKHVRFGYSSDKIIIKDFSASIKSGQKVAIVGPTGAGKTTLVNLLMRFYEVTDGSIEIDGIPVSSLTRENIHDLFGMVLQDTWLFEGTIKENLVYGREDVSDEDVKRACKAAGIHHFIKTLPEGYNTVLSDDANLSAGQKQLITIARAMIENAPMLILDEATSSVDTRTELQIQRAMDTLTKGRTSFVIAHRLSTIKNSDIILVMKDGDIIESGSHDELLAKGGFYADLWNSQFESAA